MRIVHTTTSKELELPNYTYINNDWMVLYKLSSIWRVVRNCRHHRGTIC